MIMIENSSIVIFGATGDLAFRMLFPALYFLDSDGFLPPKLRIVGASRSSLTDEAFTSRVEASLKERTGEHFSTEKFARFAARLNYVSVNAENGAGFDALKKSLSDQSEVIFYLSTSPDFYGRICAHLKASGLTSGRNRIVVEKPIGHDLASCHVINDALADAFDENRIFRIDHYLGKEAVQNLIALRFANRLFEPLWNHVSIENVQITVAETVGVEGRWSYYDDHGAMRDMVQNHLLQLLCLVAMEPPTSLAPDAVRNEKVKVLQSLKPITGRDLPKKTVRGQYSAGVAGGKTVPGYADESGGQESDTETFVALSANIDNWRWAGVPFYLRTGKRLPERSSQIIIQFRDLPHSIFPGDQIMANRLTIRLQPEEQISLLLMNKVPSLDGMQLRPLALNLSLTDTFEKQHRRRIAYERLFLEAIANNPTLFVRRDETEAAWIWVDQIINGWRAQAQAPQFYGAGTWGPSGAFALTERQGHTWYD
jgi:glucose-6-phosphate 1-dehydrogenase